MTPGVGIQVLINLADRLTSPLRQAESRVSARRLDRQVAEFQVRVAIRNGFTALGTRITEVGG